MSRLTNDEAKVTILSLLDKKGRWGVHYLSLDTLVNWLGRKIRRNGKLVRKRVKRFDKRGYIYHCTRKGTPFLNPARSKEITEYVKTVLKT